MRWCEMEQGTGGDDQHRQVDEEPSDTGRIPAGEIRRPEIGMTSFLLPLSGGWRDEPRLVSCQVTNVSLGVTPCATGH